MREPEPHSSLARIAIDIDPSVDLDVNLDVKKIEIELPSELENAIRRARTANGIDFKKYMSMADETYRKRKPVDSELPLIPSFGLPAELTEFLHEELRIKATTKHRDLKIKWKEMSRTSFFEIDRDSGHLYINRAFRNTLLHGLSGSAADIPVVKCLLFLTLEDALTSERIGPRIRERMEQANRILVKAVKYERVE